MSSNEYVFSRKESEVMAGVVHLLVDNYQDVMTTRTISGRSFDRQAL